MALARRQRIGVAERGAEIARHVPLLDQIAVAMFIERVVAVLEVGAVEHHQQHDQALIRLGADERVVFPLPEAGLLERRVLEPEPAADFDMRAEVVFQLEGRQVIDRRLVVADRRRTAATTRLRPGLRDRVRREGLLDAPLPALVRPSPSSRD